MMMRRALAVPRDQAVGTSKSVLVHASTRSYATAAAGSGGKKAATTKGSSGPRGNRGQDTQGDTRIELIKKNLYESTPSDSDRLAALARVVPSPEVHDTISRAWALHKRNKRESHARELARKYASMRHAIDVLETVDRELWDKAVGGRKFQNVDQSRATTAAAGGSGGRLEGLVPRELRPPMEVRGSRMWDSEWKAPAVSAPKAATVAGGSSEKK